VDAAGFLQWIDGYERAWRTPGTDGLAQLFATGATYSQAPYAEPILGLDAIKGIWDVEREGPDEVFTMSREVVAIDNNAGVARVEVTYGKPVTSEFRDLWIVRFDPAGRATHFEEWPFWPGGPT